MLWNQKVGKTPAGVLWHDGKVLVADMGTDYVAVVDPADGHVISRIHTGKGAHNLFLSPDRKIIWVNNRVGGTTTSLDASTLAPIRSYSIPGGPDDIDFRARWQAVDHAALGGEGGGARSEDRRLPDRSMSAARRMGCSSIPGPTRRRVSRRAEPWVIRSTSPPAGCRNIC